MNAQADSLDTMEDGEDMRLALRVLGERLAVLWSARRAMTGAVLPLMGSTAGAAEIEALFSDAAGDAAQPDFEPGSLWAAIRGRARGVGLARLAQLQERFRLSPFELECLIVCLAPECDRAFERMYACLNDSAGLRHATADLLLRVLAPASVRAKLKSLFAADARLSRYGLLIAQAEGPAGIPTYRVADGIARYLLEQGGIDAALARCWCRARHSPLAQSLWSRTGKAEELAELVRSHREDAVVRRTPLIVTLQGRPGSGRRYAAEKACEALGIGSIALDMRLLKRTGELQHALTAAFRDSMLAGAPVLLHQVDAWFDDPDRLEELRLSLERLVEELGWVLFVTTLDSAPIDRFLGRARVVEIAFPEEGMTSRRDDWSHLLQTGGGLSPEVAANVAESLAARYRLNAGEMSEAVFRALSARVVPESEEQWREALPRHAAAVAAPRLRTLAQPLHPRHRFDDLVLPEDKKDLLYDIVRRVRHRRQVMDVWGFEQLSERGRGLVALFHGPSGTGKTMAAEVIAGELGMDLYRIDLSGVVSKYIGETEKNLRAVFDEADRSDALLFFDEADALFGKRSEVRDAHDRYANIEINYLLQRIESFAGIAILATNMRQHLDEAFLRRIHVSVEFAMPEATERLGIWARSFPRAAPLLPEADLGFFAERFEIAGGTIRNIALGAAFLAAEAQAPIGVELLVAAARREFVKSGRRVLPEEFAPHDAILRGKAPLHQSQVP